MLSLFNFLKKIFNWADESSRKRHATDDLSEVYYVAPKKPCFNRYNMNSHPTYIDLEDDDAVEVISEYVAPSIRRKMSNGSYNYMPKRKSPSRVNMREHRHSELESFHRIASTPINFCIPITLNSTSAMMDKQRYSDLLQNFMPEKDKMPHILHRDFVKEPVQEVEIIEIDDSPEPQVNRKSRRSVPCKNESTIRPKQSVRQPITVIQLDEDDKLSLSGVSKRLDSTVSQQNVNQKPVIKVNTMRDRLANKTILQDDLPSKITKKYQYRQEILRKRMEEQERAAQIFAKQNQLSRDAKLSENLAKSMRLCEPFLEEIEELEEPELPKLTKSMLAEINAAWSGRSSEEVLVNNFAISIKRRDIQTLADLNWLNDEVINFYMNLLIERGKQDKYPNVYAMNTFFYSKLMQSGYASLKRWTRKVDIFAQDLLVVPVHLGIHWCMSIIDFRNKTIRYFDSMGGDNTRCLMVLKQYLHDESLDKKKKPYDTSDWKLECVKKIPQQMNGSDCGVFSCMFAEYITANKPITFSQQDMPYFRCKMVYEILHSKLL